VNKGREPIGEWPVTYLVTRVSSNRLLERLDSQTKCNTRSILAFEHSVDLAPLRWGLMDLGYAYARVGRAGEAGAQIDRLENSAGDPASYEIALILAALGRLEESYAWFDKACTERSYLLAQHGLWDPRVMQLLGNDKVIELRSRMSRTPPFLLSK
jgi:hypothetical protein